MFDITGLVIVGIILLIYFYRELYSTKVYWFHRPGCPHCDKMADEWKTFAGRTGFMIQAVAVDTTLPENKLLSDNFDFETVPHIVKVKEGIRTVYSGERKAADIMAWAC